MKIIQIKNINLGGISDSKYQGQPNSVAEMVGFDLHSEPGILKHNQKLTKESGATVDSLVKKILLCSDGNTYLFSSTNGKIWKRTSAGVYSLQATAAPAAGSVGIIDAWEYQGYIYYSMQSRLGRVAVGAPTAWAGRNDSWATFTNTDADFHPMKEVNQVLYIGDGKYLAQVDAGIFSANALDIESPYRIKSLGKILTNILIGTFVSNYKVASEIFDWNTWSTDSFQSSDDIPEIGINSFLKTDNFVLVNAGTKGNFYSYNGSQLDIFKRIQGDWSGAKEANVLPNASFNMFGLPLFGLSYFSGSSPMALQGVYSLGGYDRNYPKIVNLEWLISTGSFQYVTIGAIELVETTLLIAWKDLNDGPVFGIDKVDTTVKTTTAYFISRIINIERNSKKTLSGFVAYRSLPNDSEIEIWYSINHEAFVKATVVNDVDRKVVYLEKSFPEANTIQLKVISKAATGANANNAPEIEMAEFNYE